MSYQRSRGPRRHEAACYVEKQEAVFEGPRKRSFGCEEDQKGYWNILSRSPTEVDSARQPCLRVSPSQRFPFGLVVVEPNSQTGEPDIVVRGGAAAFVVQERVEIVLVEHSPQGFHVVVITPG